ncbi:MAG TPA: tryptophan synthase subunit alpha, partial [Limnochordales bacterium]
MAEAVSQAPGPAGKLQQQARTEAGRMLAGAFARAHREGRAALVGYWPAYFPDGPRSRQALLALAEGGCDVVEVGVPFSDPVADGPVLQEAAAVALQSGATLKAAVELAGEVYRRTGVPTVLMSYYNPLLQMGEERLAALMEQHQVLGLIVPDLPVEESEALVQALRRRQRAWVALAAPTSAGRLQEIAAGSDGFIYAVTRTGVTGPAGELSPEALQLWRALREVSALPVALGFGVSSPEQAAALRQADGVVVGTAFVQAYRNARPQGGAADRSPEQAVRELAASLRQALV